MKKYIHGIVLALAAAAFIGALAWSFHITGVEKLNRSGEAAGASFADTLRAGTSELMVALQGARWGYAPLAALVGLLVFPVKAYRWQVILGNKRVGLRPLLAAASIGFMANCIFSRVGEIIRAVVLRLKGEMRTPAALASIALERVFDICTVLLFLIIGLTTSEIAGTAESARRFAMLRMTGFIMGGILCVAIGFLVMLRFRPQFTEGLILRFTHWLPEQVRHKLQDLLESFLRGLNTIHTPQQLAWIVALSLFHWFIQVLFFLMVSLCLPAMHMGLPVAFLVFAVTGLGVGAVPLPGYIGIYQAGVLVVATLAGTSDPASTAAWVSYSWLSWALNIPFVILLGFVFLWIEDLSLKEVRNAAKSE